jgi:tetratricopeptide (TPR) repeat protein
MGTLAKPDVADGPARDLFDALHNLHHQAGWPSLRDLAREVGCSRTTVAAAFSDPRVPRWGMVELLVEALGGDRQRFHALWLNATGHRMATSAGTAPATGSGTLPPTSEAARGPWATPRQLPSDVTAFTGRVEEMEQLDRLVDLTGTPRHAMPLALLCGMGGVGKTALAVHWAHRVAERFPDGQLYVNLRGYDHGRPISPAQALGFLLRSLGEPAQSVPARLDERAARYRSLLAGRRVLVLLDNARTTEQVRDLLPGTPECLVVVTSRDALPALVARFGANRLTLGSLPAYDAVGLLGALVDRRVIGDPAGAARLADRCGRIPLALRLAAELCSSRPGVPLGALADELGKAADRLGLLDLRDPQTGMRSVFSWSFRTLDPPESRAFQVLGLHPGHDIDPAAFAAMLDEDTGHAARVLDRLSRAHLVEPASMSRYGMHDLLRSYAAGLAAQLQGTVRRDALARLLDHYARMGTAAAAVSGPDRTAALARLDAERANLLAAVSVAPAAGRPGYALRISEAISSYLDAGGHYQEALALHHSAEQAARAGGDLAAEAKAADQLGRVQRRLGHYLDALQQHRRAIAVARSAGDSSAESQALLQTGITLWHSGDYRAAGDQLREALATARKTGEEHAAAASLSHLGIVTRRLGRYPEALQWHQRALTAATRLGDPPGVARALTNASFAYLKLGRVRDAVTALERALMIVCARGDRSVECSVLTNLGLAFQALGQPAAAHAHLREALAISRRIGYRSAEGDALRALGTTATRSGHSEQGLQQLGEAVLIGRELGEADLETGARNDFGHALTLAGWYYQAAAQHEQALILARRSGDRLEQARALHGLAAVSARTGDQEGAAESRQRAERMVVAMGLPSTTLAA